MAELIYLASFSDDVESLQHYRTPGSKNGETKYPGLYQPIGKKADPTNWQNMSAQQKQNLTNQGLKTSDYAAEYERAKARTAQSIEELKAAEERRRINPRNTAELMAYQKRQAELQQRQQQRQQTNQAIGNAIARGATAAGNAIARGASGLHEYAVNQRDKRQAEANAKKNEARLQQVQYNKMRDEGRKATRDAQSAYSKAKGAAHYKLEEGKRAMRKVGKSLGETSTKARQKGREVLGKLGVGDYARDVGRIASNAKTSAKNAWEKGKKNASDLYEVAKRTGKDVKNRVTDAYRLDRAKNDKDYAMNPQNWGKIATSAGRSALNDAKDALNKRRRR